MGPYSRGLLVLLAVGVAMIPCPRALAHGGQYRGPVPTASTGGARPGATGALRVPGGAGGPAGPTTGGGIPLSNNNSWQIWWEFNKDPFLRLREAIHEVGSTTGSDQFFMGNQAESRDALEPTVRDKVEKILPALVGALDSTRNRDIITACLVAIAKIGMETDKIELLPLFRTHLVRNDQEVRETATLSMGIAGLTTAEGDLVHLLGDTREGRKLVNRPEVDDRTRTFAAYALGFLARRSPDVGLKERVYESLTAVLEDRRNPSRDLALAAVQSLGLLDPDAESSSRGKLLLWKSVDTLWRFYERDMGKAWQIMQSHVPGAMARLLGRGSSTQHERVKAALAGELTRRASRQISIYQSSALALGSLALPVEERAEDGVYSEALLDYFRSGHDQQARYFCLIALGRIGGDRNRGELLKIHDEAQTATTKPWSAMALGLVARAGLEETESSPTVDKTIGSLLHRDFLDIANPNVRSALAVALGLAGYLDSSDDLLEELVEAQLNDNLAGYICIGLALMDERRAVDDIRNVVSRSVRRPALLQQAAIALGKLGDKKVTEFLQEMLKGDRVNVARMSAVAVGLGFVGDRRSIDPLIGLLEDDRNLTMLARAFVAAALGGIGDKDNLPWNSVLARDINYEAGVSTLTNGQNGVLDIL